jgi:uncharacterized protein
MNANASSRRLYVLVDGENIDATLGGSILRRRPGGDERPRWERITGFARGLRGQQVTGLFFLNASSGQLPVPFIQALTALDYRPIPLSGTPDQKVVDLGILRTLQALRDRDADVLLASHDGDFADDLAALNDGTRAVGLLAFREFVSQRIANLGIPIYDLEDEVRAFNVTLPRLRIIPVDQFDPTPFLD